MAAPLQNRVRALREARGMSQGALAERARLSRQSVSAIEAGRVTPAVDVALRLAQALDAPVEELFSPAAAVESVSAVAAAPPAVGRVALGHVRGRFVAHALDGDGIRVSADGLATPAAGGARCDVELVRAPADVRQNVLLMGCAAALGLLADRLNSRPGAGRFLWLQASSTASLEALAQGHVHVAGVHLVDTRTGEANVSDVRRVARGEPLVLLTLARWEAGLVTRRQDAERLRGVADLARRGVRVVTREQGAGARRLLERELRAAGAPVALAQGPLQAAGHLEVARAVAMGAADAGVATRDAAMAWGLRFVPLAEERYDLTLPAPLISDPRLQRLVDVLVSAAFRRELDALGYDTRPSGERVAEVHAR